MSFEDDLYRILWGIGGLVLGTFLTFLLVFFTENSFRLRVMNAFTKGSYAALKVLTDRNTITTKIFKKTNKQVKVFDSQYSPDLSKLISEDGNPVLTYHHSNCISPASWRPYDEVRIYYMIPSAIKAQGTAEVPGDKKGEKKQIYMEFIIPANKIEPVQLPPEKIETKNVRGETVLTLRPVPQWVIMEQKVERTDSITKPSEFASLINLNETEMETNAALMNRKQLEDIKKYLLLMVLGVGIMMVLTVIALYWLNQLNGNVGIVKDNFGEINNTLSILKNQTVYSQSPITWINNTR